MDEVLLSHGADVPAKADQENQPISPSSSCHHLQDHLSGSDVIAPVDACRPFIGSANNTSAMNLITSLSKKRILSRRSYSSPSLLTDSKESPRSIPDKRPAPESNPSIVLQAFFGICAYIVVVVFVYLMKSKDFKGKTTLMPVDALYFSVVTLCTIGYGDIVPDTTSTKILTCAFILVGFGFIDILLNGLVTYVLDRQEAVLLTTMDQNWRNPLFHTYIMDMKKGRMRIRMKVALALAVVFSCIAVGMVMAHLLEDLNFLDSFYLSITSVTTVGYGDYTFKTTMGRIFASIWLPVSTLAVARAFLYLTELRIDKRNREVAKRVLQKKMTIGDLVAADLDNDGSVSKAEYVIFKLKEMGKIAEKDILQICSQFDGLDSSNCGKITVSDLMES